MRRGLPWLDPEPMFLASELDGFSGKESDVGITPGTGQGETGTYAAWEVGLEGEAGTLPKPRISGELGQKGLTGVVTGVVGDLPPGCTAGDLERGPVGHQL